MPQKILVTGATGTIGANVVKRLVEEGYHVRSQVRPGSARLKQIQHLGTEIYPLDLSHRTGFDDMVKNVDAIIHMPMWTGTNDKFNTSPEIEGLLDVNMASTLFLLEAVRQHNPTLQRFVHASSSVLYPQVGFNTNLFQEKDKRTRPVGMYAVSKLVGELFANTYHHEHHIPTVILTIPETFCGREILGERARNVSPFLADHIHILKLQPPSKVVDLSLKALEQLAKEGNQLLVPLMPDGTPWRRHLGDVRDVARACVHALKAPRAVGEAFVIMSDALDYGIGVPHLAQITGMKYAEEFVPVTACYWYDLQKTRDVLGFSSEIDSRRILQDAWHHHQGQDIGIIAGQTYPHIKREF